MAEKKEDLADKENDQVGVESTDTANGPWQKTFKQFKKAMGHVTLEPMLFLKMVAEGNTIVIGDTLEIDRVCRVNLNFSQEDCMAMDDGNHSQIQEAVQVYQNTFNYYQSLIASILPVLVILFAGSISDQYGRKLPMVTVLAGFVMFSVIYIITALNPSWPVEVLYAATVAVNATGSWVVFNMAVYSYLADITTMETRTKRMGWMDAIWYMGGPIGTLMGGWLYQAYGIATVFAVSGVLWLLCIIYVILIVKESIATPTETTPKGKPYRYVLDLGRAVFKAYPNRGRIHLFLLMAVKLGVFLVQGHQVYLWARRVLGWDATQFSIWTGTDEAVHQIGMVVWVGLASYYHLSDHTVATFGLVSIVAWNIVLACITGPSMWWLVIIATLSGSLEGSIEPALRTLITSIPDKKDIGKILAFLGLLEAIWLIVDKSLYTFLYNAFIESFPQINFVVESFIAILLIIVVVMLKKDWLKHRDSNSAKPSTD